LPDDALVIVARGEKQDEASTDAHVNLQPVTLPHALAAKTSQGTLF
jgi:hypothetical protein